MSKKDFIITAIIVVLSIALIAVIIVAKRAENKTAAPTTVPSSSVAHDHDGDGVADHDDSAHATEGVNDPNAEDTDISVGIEDLPENTDGTTNTEGTTATEATSGTGNAVTGENIEFDDLINAGQN